jgi:hypothetical protein
MQEPTDTDQERGGTVHLALEWALAPFLLWEEEEERRRRRWRRRKCINLHPSTNN